jgi:hypothetical protein
LNSGRLPAGHQSAPREFSLVAGILLTVFALQASVAAVRDSVTIDEFVGVPVGLYTLQAVDFRSESMNPPFFRSFAALPLLLNGPTVPRIPPMNEVNDWAMGYRFMHDYADSYHALFVPARCMVIFIAVLLGTLVFNWGVQLYGPRAGLVALALFAFSPTILANGHLVTLDMSGALGWFAVSYLTWRFLDQPTVSRSVTLGSVLGLSMVLKLSGVILPLLVVLLVLIMAVSERPERWRLVRLITLLGLAQLLALGVLNGLYRFEGFGDPVGGMEFHSRNLVRVAQALPWLRIPLPEPFLKSLDVLFVGDEPTEPAYFLAGAWSLHGWWYYHFVAFALKAPLPLILSASFAIWAWARGRSQGLRDYCVFVPALGVFVANSVFNPLNIGVRHALPVFPLLALGASPWLVAPIDRLVAGSRTLANSLAAALSAALLVWFATTSVSVAPRYLQYFNELAGGSDNGHQWLIDSNIDWGQDLVRLSEYMREAKLDSVHLAYFGRVDPAVYGITYTPLVEGKSHGPAVVSASFLMGRPYWIWRRHGELDWAHFKEFTWLQKHEPVARVGAMFVFDLP